MLELIEHNKLWYIVNTETGKLALSGAGFIDRDYAVKCMEILLHPPTVEDVEEKEESIRVKRP